MTAIRVRLADNYYAIAVSDLPRRELIALLRSENDLGYWFGLIEDMTDPPQFSGSGAYDVLIDRVPEGASDKNYVHMMAP